MTPTERVQQALEALGLGARVVTFDESTHTASDAAEAVGCEPGQIVKTLFFLADGRPAMVLAAGDRQVDVAALAAILGVTRKRLKMGTPEEVVAYTGYTVGAVSPVGWPSRPDIVIDDSLKRFEKVWAAAGAVNAVFAANPAELAGAIGGQWAAISRAAA